VLKRLGIVTSGGDAPGMNAAIRAVVRTAIPKGFEVFGFERGYEGLVENHVRRLDLRSVGGIINFGGTILHVARSSTFMEKEGIQRAVKNLDAHDIDGLIVIGGDGSFKGAIELSKNCGVSMIGVPATIDNDVFGTDETIGFDTAVNTALWAIDKIRDTATSHERVFVIEVMGRTRGFLALSVGLTAGAEIILVPEVKVDLDETCEKLKESRKKGKKSSIIVAAEGVGDTRAMVEEIKSCTGYEVRLSVLGYIQRGGNPTARSRLLAELFGDKAVELLLEGERNRLVGLQDGRIVSEDLEHSVRSAKNLDMKLLHLAKELAA